MTAYRLVIAEKPSVAASIAAALGAKEKKDGYMQCSPQRERRCFLATGKKRVNVHGVSTHDEFVMSFHYARNLICVVAGTAITKESCSF